MVEQDLFQDQDGGSIPTSPLQFTIKKIDKRLARDKNKEWHSRVPEIKNWGQCYAFGLFFDNSLWGIAMWSHPIARHFNGRGFWELRRMALRDGVPRNTASRMISVMAKIIKREMPEIVKLISYQDCSVHVGTIYKASNWVMTQVRDRGKEKAWTNRPGRIAQTTTNVVGKCNSKKARWELDLKPNAWLAKPFMGVV